LLFCSLAFLAISAYDDGLDTALCKSAGNLMPDAIGPTGNQSGLGTWTTRLSLCFFDVTTSARTTLALAFASCG